MDEVSVPISWVRTHQPGEALAMDPANVATVNGNSLQANKSPATVAVYLLQLYPVTQACMTQPCVAGTPVTLTAPIVSQVPLQISTTSASNAAFIASPHPVEDCKPVEPHSVKLEPLCIVTEQPAEVKTEPYDGAPTEWRAHWKEEREEPQPHATSPPCHFHNGSTLPEEYSQHSESSQTQPQISPQAFAAMPNGMSSNSSSGLSERVSLAQSMQPEVSNHAIITTAKFQSSVDVPAVSRHPHQQQHQHQQHLQQQQQHHQHQQQHQHHHQQQHQHHQHHQLPLQVGDKPYSCNVCGKSFARAHNLKSHSQTHSGELPFSCKICRKSYSQEAYFRIHSELLSGGRPYACDICRKLFCNSRSFNFHVRSHSRRKYNVRCAACGDDFTSCKEYEAHAAIHHNHQATIQPSQPSQPSQPTGIPITLHLQEKAAL